MCRAAIALQFNTTSLPSALPTAPSFRATLSLIYSRRAVCSCCCCAVRCKRDLVNTPRVHGKLINIFVHLMACSAWCLGVCVCVRWTLVCISRPLSCSAPRINRSEANKCTAVESKVAPFVYALRGFYLKSETFVSFGAAEWVRGTFGVSG